MPRYVAFLRAVNLGGGSTVKMESLRRFFEELGFSNVSRTIASGQPAAGSYSLSYDAENRLVKVCQDANANGACDTGETVIASFVCDGYGNRVQSTLGSTTTTFVGNYYEVSGSTISKYYYAGSSGSPCGSARMGTARIQAPPTCSATNEPLGDSLLQ